MDAAEKLARERRNTQLGAAVVVLAAGAAAAYFFARGAPPPAPAVAASAPDAAAAPVPKAPDLAAEPAPDPAVPGAPQDGDSVLRRVVGRWSSSPDLAAYLAEDGILQRVAAAINLTARGSSPRPVLGFMKLSGDYEVDEVLEGKVERIFVAERSHTRYAKLTELVTSIDPAVAARGYAQLRPWFDKTYAQIATAGERFDTVLRTAIDRLVEVPVPEGRVELVPKGALYLYADPALEGRRPVEKHLLRFGAANQRAIQAWLMAFAAAAQL